jgi:predicted nucleic acid-binding protein
MVGLLDTSVVIDLDDVAMLEALPDEVAICTITLAELSAGPQLASTRSESARRQVRLQQVESNFEPIPFDKAAALSFGLVVAAVTQSGRTHRRRFADLLIAATAHAHGLVLYTRNQDDFAGIENLVEVVSI